MKSKFLVEMTDTYGGEANFSWCKRWMITASTIRGAMRKLSTEVGGSFKIDYTNGDHGRYNQNKAAVCVFVSYMSNVDALNEMYVSLPKL